MHCMIESFCDIENDMTARGPYRIPSINALISFESAARYGNFSWAASELATSQPAVSRHIASLENQLATQLFKRSPSGVTLTEAGQRLFDAAVAGLGVIHAGAAETSRLTSGKQLVIACAHDLSHLVVFARYQALKDSLGEGIRIRLLTFRNHPKDTPIDSFADVMLIWSRTDQASIAPAGDTAWVFPEEVQLICSPEYAATHAETLGGPIAGWGGLTFLDLRRPNRGWASWSEWFARAGHPAAAPRYEAFDDYIQVLEAAATGLGIALGWRNFMGRYLNSGAVVMLDDAFVEFDGGLFVTLTPKGRTNPAARTCFSFFKHWVQQ